MRKAAGRKFGDQDLVFAAPALRRQDLRHDGVVRMVGVGERRGKGPAGFEIVEPRGELVVRGHEAVGVDTGWEDVVDYQRHAVVEGALGWR